MTGGRAEGGVDNLFHDNRALQFRFNIVKLGKGKGGRVNDNTPGTTVSVPFSKFMVYRNKGLQAKDEQS